MSSLQPQVLERPNAPLLRLPPQAQVLLIGRWCVWLADEAKQLRKPFVRLSKPSNLIDAPKGALQILVAKLGDHLGKPGHEALDEGDLEKGHFAARDLRQEV